MTEKQVGDILKSMIIIVDTREKKNQHILDWFTANGIKYVRETLNHGDYSFYVTNEKYSSLSKCLACERKNSLDEITGNFTTNRERFVREFERAKEHNTDMNLVIENTTWKKVANESYRSKMSGKALTASMLSFHFLYDCPIWFTGKDESGFVIYNILWYGLRDRLKHSEKYLDKPLDKQSI